MATWTMHWQPARHLHLRLLAMAKCTFLQPSVCDTDVCLIRGAVALAKEVAGHQRGHANSSLGGREVQDACNTHSALHHQTIFQTLQNCPPDGVRY